MEYETLGHLLLGFVSGGLTVFAWVLWGRRDEIKEDWHKGDDNASISE
jgi:hypothetical protein